jgi:hypothetical protein
MARELFESGESDSIEDARWLLNISNNLGKLSEVSREEATRRGENIGQFLKRVMPKIGKMEE